MDSVEKRLKKSKRWIEAECLEKFEEMLRLLDKYPLNAKHYIPPKNLPYEIGRSNRFVPEVSPVPERFRSMSSPVASIMQEGFNGISELKYF